MVTRDDLEALKAEPGRATFRDVLALVAEVERLRRGASYWDARCAAYERTLQETIGGLEIVGRLLARCRRVEGCQDLIDAREIAIEVLAWKDAQA